MTVADLRELGSRALKEAGIEDHDTDPLIILERILKKNRTFILTEPDTEVGPNECERFLSCIEDRKKRIPLQYILGVADFMGLEFYVNQDVLIPRFDTEFVTEEVMIATDDGMRVLDLCTGSGCILLSLMCYKNDLTGVGSDISEGAVRVARKNAEALKEAGRLNGSAEFITGDLFENVNGSFDIIVSNPPYIRSGDISSLMSEVKDHEPGSALDGGRDGLDFYRRIADEAFSYLNAGGRIFLEIGYDQGDDVRSIFAGRGYRDVRVKKDYSGNERVVSCLNR